MSARGDFVHEGSVLHARLEHRGGDRYVATVGARTYEVHATRGPDGVLRFSLDGARHVAESARCGKLLQVRFDGHTHALESATGRARAGGEAAAANVVEAPMTGTVTKVLVTHGQQVEKGDTLVVLTAMKMEHKLRAGIAGKVVELAATEGAITDAGAVLVRLQ